MPRYSILDLPFDMYVPTIQNVDDSFSRDKRSSHRGKNPSLDACCTKDLSPVRLANFVNSLLLKSLIEASNWEVLYLCCLVW